MSQEAVAQQQAQEQIVIREGKTEVTTNLPDRVLVLGLIESGKFALMLQDVQRKSPLIKPANGTAGLINRMRP